MKVIIAGSRTITDQAMVRCIIEDILEKTDLEITEVVSGNARGVDICGECYADEEGIPIKAFPVTKEAYTMLGNFAPLARNSKMADYADALIAIWDGQSRGTKDMIDKMVKLEKPVYVFYTDTGGYL